MVQTHNASGAKAAAMAFSPSGEASAALQRELLETYQRLSQAWIERVQSEVELWTRLANSLASTASVSDALASYSACLSKQIQMTAEDGQRLFNDYQEISETIARAVRTLKEPKTH